MNETPFYIWAGIMVLFFLKDSINGRSLGKRITKLQVVDNFTGQVASPVKCFVRNLFSIFFPIEAIVLLVDPERRLGDFVAGTKVVSYRYATPLKTTKGNAGQYIRVLAMVAIFAVIWVKGVGAFLFRINNKNMRFIERSYNEKESHALVTIIQDSLGAAIQPDVRIYDSLQGERKMYISVLGKVEDDAYDDPNALGNMKQNIRAIIYSRYSKDSIVGQMKFYRKDGKSMVALDL